MTMHEITRPGRLLTPQGTLREPGFARSPLLDYSRDDVAASSLRLKEWDYYLVYDREVAVALTIADNGYMGLVSATYLDFSVPRERTASVMNLMPRGRMALPTSSQRGDIHYRAKGRSFDCEMDDDSRHLEVSLDRFEGDGAFAADLVLTDAPRDSMVIATPFAGRPKAFYYNRKIVGMRAAGTVTCPLGSHTFSPADSFAILDWGRGVWTYDNVWYWGGAAGEQDGHRVGWNIGYGFGDTSAASENMLFVDGIAHKLSQVTFGIPGDGTPDIDYLAPWTFSSDDGRFEMAFSPIIDRKSCTDAGLLLSDQHQVFGRYDGRAVLDDGTTLEVRDLIGFAEKVHNRW